MRAFTALGRYTAHPDPATATTNAIAVMVGSSGPTYPIYIWLVAPEAAVISLWTMLASPFSCRFPG